MQVGITPRIVCVNKATLPLGVAFDLLIAALQKYVDEHLAPVWGTPAKLVRTTKPRRGDWTLLFVDTANAIRGLRAELEKIFGKGVVDEIESVHLVRGQPAAFVFVQNVLRDRAVRRDRDKVSLAASHELAEMLVDPGNNLWADAGKGLLYAYEVCDAVESTFFPVNGLAMTDFLYPAYFNKIHKPKSAQLDHLKKVRRPFQILKDGYAPVRKAGKIKIKVVLLASPKKKRELRKENRDLHRTEFR
jgi:hypothetical protein